MKSRACYLLTWYFLSFSWPLDRLAALPTEIYVETTSGLKRVATMLGIVPSNKSLQAQEGLVEPKRDQTTGVSPITDEGCS